jgi:hypothetical protein
MTAPIGFRGVNAFENMMKQAGWRKDDRGRGASDRVPAETMPNANAIPVIDFGAYLADESGALDHAAA